MAWLKGKKAYISAILIAVNALLGVLTGDITVVQFLAGPELNMLLVAFGIASLRNAIS